jgi:hypothetical protein
MTPKAWTTMKIKLDNIKIKNWTSKDVTQRVKGELFSSAIFEKG